MEAIGRMICGFQCFDMQPVYEVVEEIEIVVRGKPFLSKSYYRKGLSKYIGPDGKKHFSDITTLHDCGADGVSKLFSLEPADLPTEEERILEAWIRSLPTKEECAKGQEHIQETFANALIAQGIW